MKQWEIRLKSRRTIDKFIQMRLQGITYDAIVKKLGVSKPTLIKWGKLYKKEIEYARIILTEKLAEKIAKNNKDLINGIAKNLKRAERNNKVSQEIKVKFIKRAYKRLGDIFNIKVKNVELTLNDEGDVINVFINVED